MFPKIQMMKMLMQKEAQERKGRQQVRVKPRHEECGGDLYP
jgi:hypothetical protein